MTREEMLALKKYLGYSNKKLAEEAGLPLGTVQKVLSGETEAPRYKTLIALSNALNRGLSKMHAAYDPLSASGTAPAASEVHENDPAYEYRAYGAEDTGEIIPDIIEDAYTRRWRRQGTYTVRDYEAIPEGVRVELIDGVFYDMAAPFTAHQIIIGEVFTAMSVYRKSSGRKDCRPMTAPFDVQLDMDEKTMVQPDLLVICKKEGRDLKKRLYGAPEYVMEVLSESTREKDLEKKRNKYSNAGVREYWIVDPDAQKILVYDFEGLNFPKTYTFDDKVPVLITGGDLVIDWSEIKNELEAFLG